MASRPLFSNPKIIFVSISILLIGGILFFLNQTQASNTIAVRDATRISDLKQVQSELELYFSKCSYYPGSVQAQDVCSLWVRNNTWAGLSAAIVASKLGIANIPNDPTSGKNYFFGAQLGGKGYVLGAALEDPANPSLVQSVHGIVNDLDCSGSVYCIQVSK